MRLRGGGLDRNHVERLHMEALKEAQDEADGLWRKGVGSGNGTGRGGEGVVEEEGIGGGDPDG